MRGISDGVPKNQLLPILVFYAFVVGFGCVYTGQILCHQSSSASSSAACAAFVEYGCRSLRKLGFGGEETVKFGQDALVSKSFPMPNSNIEIEQSEDEVIEVEVDGRLGVSSDGEDINGHQSKADHDTLMKCIDALTMLDGIDGASFAKAAKLIHDDPLWRNIFLRLSDDRRRDWVLYI